MQLKVLIEDNTTPAGRVVELFIHSLIIGSLITFSVETLPNLSGTTQRWLRYFEILCVAIFTVEYLARVAVADRKRRFVFSFFGLVDLAAILPFYLTTSVDLRAVRVFRMLRLIRALKLLRYSKALRRFRIAFSMVREELILFFLTTLFLLFVASVGIYYFEHSAQPKAFASVFHGFWWAVATLTTVGYGDVAPITPGGKAFTFVILMVGLGIVAVPTGVIASALTKTIDFEREAESTALPSSSARGFPSNSDAFEAYDSSRDTSREEGP